MNNKKKSLIVLIVVASILAIFNPKSINLIRGLLGGEERKVINIMELELPHSSQIIHRKFDEHLLQYWDGILYSYDMNGSQNWSINIGITNPIIEVSDMCVYIVDKGKNQLTRISKNGEIQYRTVLDKKISFIKSDADDILLAIHTPENSTLKCVSIINKAGKKTGEILLNEGEIINASVTSKNNRIALYTMGVYGGKLEANLIQYNLKGELLRLDGIQDQVGINMYYDPKGNLMIVYEDRIDSLDSNHQLNWQLSTDKIRQVISSNEYLVVYSGKDGRGGIIQGRSREKIKLVDFNGRVMGEKALNESIQGIDTYKNEVIVYSNRSIFLLNKKADIIMDYKFSTDLEGIMLWPLRHVAIMTKEKLSFMKIQ